MAIQHRNLPGFSIRYGFQQETSSFDDPTNKALIHQKNYFSLSSNGRFPHSNFMEDAPDYIVGLEGMAFGEVSDTSLLELFQKYGKGTPRHLRGEFSGLIYTKATEALFLFNNITGSRPLFYSILPGNRLLVSPNIQAICQERKELGYSNALNEEAAYYLLTYGGMLDQLTLIEGIHRLHAGEYLFATPEKITVETYFHFNEIDILDKPKSYFFDRLTEQLDEAIRQEYEVDLKLGLPSLSTLSGGLDSRVVVMRSQELGYSNEPFCFSQSGYADEWIARDIAHHLGIPFHFIPLDGGAYMLELEQNMATFQGQIFYLTSGHFRYGIDRLPLSDFGLIHTGLLGDGILGTHITQPKTAPPNLQKKLLSKILFPKIESMAQKRANQFASEEVYHFYNRFCNVIISGAWAVAPFSVLTSPFMHQDVIAFCLSIPPEYKYNQAFYVEWLNQNHPNWTQFPWERTMMRPKTPWQTDFSRYTNKARSIFYRVTGQSHRNTMTPYDKWAKDNPTIQEFYQSQYTTGMESFPDGELKKDLSILFQQGSRIEQSCVLTLLHASHSLQ